MGEDDLTPAEPLSAPARASERRARFARWLAPQLIPVLKVWLPPLLVLLASAGQHWAGKADTEKKVHVGYETDAHVIKAQSAEIDDLKATVAQQGDSLRLLLKIALSGQPGFNTTGAPVKVTAVAVGQRARHVHVVVPPADPALVKKLQENEVKNQALQAHLVKAKAQPSPTVPLTLPAEAPPAPPAIPAQAPAPTSPKPAAQEWPPPVPDAAAKTGSTTP